MFKHIISGSFCMLLLLLASGSVFAEQASSLARGGQLYDKWFKVIGVDKPTNTHPAWPASNTKKKGNATHRCKSCHGWDLMGKDGAYASGSYKTGITGLRHLQGEPKSKVISAMKDSTHGYSGKMSEADFYDLANFVVNGQVDMDKIINRQSKASIGGNNNRGEAYYNTLCANCHDKSGKGPKDMPPLGALSWKNPWEIIQKIMNGQPDEEMPAMRAFNVQVSVDILSHLQTLPKE
ncbi:MAG: cytochrome c [Gammaproteobacteria bacterium]|nr:cytochrome c [Gammaproteobacteria bacterium]